MVLLLLLSLCLRRHRKKIRSDSLYLLPAFENFSTLNLWIFLSLLFTNYITIHKTLPPSPSHPLPYSPRMYFQKPGSMKLQISILFTYPSRVLLGKRQSRHFVLRERKKGKCSRAHGQNNSLPGTVSWPHAPPKRPNLRQILIAVTSYAVVSALTRGQSELPVSFFFIHQ